MDEEIEVNLDQEPEGVLVRSQDGEYFFLAQSDQERLRVYSENKDAVEKMFSAGPSAPPSAAVNCARTFKWLLSHNPNSMHWRKVSVIWMANC